jgi:hypothetical protein
VKTAHNPLIYEVHDFGVVLTNHKAEMLAEGSGLPGFIGCLPAAIASGLALYGPEGFADGDVLLTNEPDDTGTHLSDVVVYMPILHEGRLVAFSSVMAHWADIGGHTPGGWCPDTTDVHQEGMIFSHLKLIEAGKINATLERMILKNVRFPDLVRTTPPGRLDLGVLLRTYWVSPHAHPDFAWAWLCRFLVSTAIMLVQVYLYYYVVDELGIARDRADGVLAHVMVTFLGSGLVTAVALAWISDRTGRRRPIVAAACAVTAAGIIAALLAPTLLWWLVAIAVVGAGQGAFVAVDVALMTEVLPSLADAGRDLGIVALSYLLPQVIAPLVGGLLLATSGEHGYTAVYLTAAACCLAAAYAVTRVRSVD